ncbi:MAG: DUF3995 domain-containing protein [Acidobacteriota bacterium]|nr:DUF3995 domain-containing protein [Acidobacteriota bacterium]
MIPIPALVLFVVFLALACLHVFWAFSGRLGWRGVIPTADGAPVIQPGIGVTLLVAALLFAAAVVSLWRGAWPDAGPSWVPRSGIWVVATIFAARAVGDFRYVGFFKKVRHTAFARNDTLIFSPLCAAISMLSLWLAVFY